MAYYDEVKKEWIVEDGTYTLKLGNSSRDILQEVSIQIE
jgi:beta-glucosidase